MGISRTDPSTHPITLAQAKATLRVDTSIEDALILDLIGAATEHAQDFTSRQFVQSAFTWTLDDFPNGDGVLYVPRSPLVSVASIKYDDADGVEQTFAASKYIVSTGDAVGRISLKLSETWPSTRAQRDAVRVVFTAGYATTPHPVKQAIRMLIAHMYEHREAVVIGTISSKLPLGVEAMLYPYKIFEVA